MKIEVDLDRQPVRPMILQDAAVMLKASGSKLTTQIAKYAVPARFSVSQTFDIGNDCGSGVLDGYGPWAFQKRSATRCSISTAAENFVILA